MYTGLLHLHNLLRWLIIIVLVVLVLRHLMAASTKRSYDKTDSKLALFAMIFCDTTLLVGLYQWMVGPWGLKAIQNAGMATVMKDATTRFFAVEHFIGMLLAIALVHIGKGIGKKNIADTTKHSRSILFFGLALLIILISIPWPFREVGAGRGWFPGM